MRRLKKTAKILAALYFFITIMLYFFQEKLIFLPTKLPQEHAYEFSHEFEEFNLKTDDGAVLNALHFRTQSPKGLILYFHGNAGDLSRWGNITGFFVEQNYDVVVMDYRTYGKSTGKLSEKALHADAQLFYDYAIKQYSEQEITLYGRSLGTGIATKLASKNNPVRLLLESPYYSLRDVAKGRFPFLPVEWLLKYQFLSSDYIQNVDCQIAIFHGTADNVISYASGKRLFDAIAGDNKRLYTIVNGEHNNLIEFEAYKKGIEEILTQRSFK